jgi:hypothetical protein
MITDLDKILLNTITFDKDKHYANLQNEYIEKLNKYIPIKSTNDLFFNVKKGGYIKYVTFNNELKTGGIIVKIDNKNDDTIITLKANDIFYKISFNNNYVFYLSHRTSSDKMKDLFLNMVDNF